MVVVVCLTNSYCSRGDYALIIWLLLWSWDYVYGLMTVVRLPGLV